MKKGVLITFEGGEGSGKSVQVEILANHLREKGCEVVVTREPGGTRIGEHIRNITHDPENVDLDPKTEAYLMAAARAQHVAEVINPALKQRKIVICDRFLDSSIVYQGYGRGLGEQTIITLNQLAVGGIIPDLTILLDISVSEGLSRRHNGRKKIDRLDLQQRDFYERIRQGYQKIALKEPRIYVISGTKSIEEIAKLIWDKVKKLLKLKKQ